MNKIYRLVWNGVREAWVVAAEGTRARGKSSPLRRRALAVAVAGALGTRVALAAPPTPTTLPTGGQVVAGQATIATTGATMNIQQATDKAILNWQSFSIGSGAAVNFAQPGAGSVALNRVLGSDPSQIYGRLTSNGQVFLVNPGGVLFGPGAKVDVQGLVASTLDIRNEDFLAGNNRFTRNGATGSVVNEGDLTAKYVALLAPEVRNQGVIAARMGTVALAAGDAVTLGITGSNLVSVQVERATIDTLVANSNLVQADAGTVIMSAQSANALLGRVVNSGAVEANGISTDGGVVRLVASSGIEHSGLISVDAGTSGKGGSAILIADLGNAASVTTLSGSISARGGSSAGDGGFVETSASRLKILDSARVDTRAPNGVTGRWLLDPHDFTIAAAGGDMTGTALTASLANTSVEIQSANGSVDGGLTSGGDINVNDAVSWSANTLTLTAARDININAVMTASGTASLAMNAATPNGAGPEIDPGGAGTIKVGMGLDGFRGRVDFSGTGTLEIGGNAYTVISDKTGLQNMNLDLTGLYALGADFTSAGAFTPVGDTTTAFTGTFEGLGHVITGLSVSGAANGTGLFGASGGDVRNVGLKTVSIASDPGANDVGGLVGFNSGRVRNSFVTGAVSAPTSSNVGGLVGRNLGEVTRSYSTADVTGLNSVGGLVGKNDYTSGAGAPVPNPDCFINPFCSPATIPGPNVITQGPISYSYATGKVTGTSNVGGLVGTNQSTVFFSYATGEIAASAGANLGGLVGNNYNATDPAALPSIDSSFSTGKVNSGTATNVGGLVGNNNDGGTPSNVTRSFWDKTTSTQATSAGGNGAVGMITADMKAQANYTGPTVANGNTIVSPAVNGPNDPWNFADVWFMYEGNTYPLLQTFLTPVSVKVNSVNRVYGDANPAFAFTYTDSSGTASGTAPATHLQGAASVTGAPATTANADIYPILPSGLYSDQQGYRITAVAGNSVTVNPKPMDVTVAKTYDATANFTTGFNVTGTLVGADAPVTVTGGLATTSSANAGNYTSFATSNLTLSNTNYTLTGGNVAATIDPKVLNITATKTYDATANFGPSIGDVAFTLNGVVANQAVTVNGGLATTANANAGNFAAFATNNLTLSSTNYTLTGGTVAASISPKALSVLGLTAGGDVTSGAAANTAVPIAGNATLLAPVTVAAGTATDKAPYDTDGPLTITGTPAGATTVAAGGSGTVPVGVSNLTLNGTGATNYTLTGTSVSATIRASVGGGGTSVIGLIQNYYDTDGIFRSVTTALGQGAAGDILSTGGQLTDLIVDNGRGADEEDQVQTTVRARREARDRELSRAGVTRNRGRADSSPPASGRVTVSTSLSLQLPRSSSGEGGDGQRDVRTDLRQNILNEIATDQGTQTLLQGLLRSATTNPQ